MTIATWINESSLHCDHANAKSNYRFTIIGGKIWLEKLVIALKSVSR